jgi:hypothetical protein
MLFNSPVGTEEERSLGKIWPGQWFDATPYPRHYEYGYHTGADLNNNSPHWDGDAHAAVYAMGSGVVTYAQLFSTKYWGNIIVIDHGIVDGKPLFSRYGHVEAIQVLAGQSVGAGDQISRVGKGPSEIKNFPYHLHFDISTTLQLRSTPYYWPGEDKKSVLHHFVDPREWLRKKDHVVESSLLMNNVLTNDDVRDVKPSTTSAVWYIVAPDGAKIRKDPGITSEEVGSFSFGSKFSIEAGGGNQDGYTWAHISGGEFHGHWLAIYKEDKSETYASTNPPHK